MPEARQPIVRVARWDVVVPLALAIALGLGTVGFVWLAGRALAVFVLAVTLAAALAPLIDRLSGRMGRTVAVVLVYVAGAAAIALLAAVALPRLGSELQDLSSRGPQIAQDLRARVQTVVPDAVQLERLISGAQEPIGRAIRQVPMQLASFVFELLVIVFLSLYLLMVAPRLRWFVISLFPRRHRRRARLIWCRLGRAMGGYVRGVAIDGAIIAVLTWLALTIIGVDFAVPLAVLAGLGEFVPYIGPVVAAVPAIAIGLLDSVQQAIIVAATYLVLQQVESHIVTPNVMHTQTDIRPATVIVALTVGYTVGGVLGAITAIPIFAAGRVLIRRLVAPAIRRAGRREGSGAREPG